MVTALRRTGIDIIGGVPWGTHFCLFYETKEDLLDILIPYFKAGLENNEFCLWVHYEPLRKEEAIAALRRAIPGVDRHLAAGDIEIWPHTKWYLKDGTFDPQRVINGWNEKLADALVRGYAGMRVNGNEAWLTKKRWQDFMVYEDKLNEVMANQRMIVLCTYPLAKSRAGEVFDAARTHDFTTVRRNGNWETLETPELKQTKIELARLNEELEQRVDKRTRELAATAKELRKEIRSCERAEKALKKAEGELRTLFAAIMDVVLVVDAEGRYVKIGPTNPLNQYRPPEELLGKKAHDVLPKEEADKFLHQIGCVLERHQAIDFEHELKIRGREVWFESRLSPLTEETVFWIARDITERKQAEKERQNLEERLQRAEKMEALGTLAGGVAHDLNNVLGIVVGYAEMVIEEMDESSPLREDVMKIMEGGHRSAAIVQDLLTLARRGVKARKVFNLNTAIRDCQKTPEFEKLLSFHPKVKIKTDLEADLLNIMGSPVHLGKTFFNLVANAGEAMPHGGTLTITTKNQSLDKPVHGYDTVSAGDYVVLSIMDTGDGIPDRDIGHIFEPFYTKKAMGRSGTGLGLSVVWGTVKDHNGYIDVESAVGKGTTFALYFPVTREEIAKAETSIPLSDYIGNDESILVIDDIKEQRELAAKMLGKLNYKVTTVSSGEEAVKYLRTRKVDMVVLDMIMDPGMDGLDTYKAIIQIHPKQKAIIVSGFSETERVTEAKALGVGEYLRKPYVIERFGLAVRKELDRK